MIGTGSGELTAAAGADVGVETENGGSEEEGRICDGCSGGCVEGCSGKP